MKGKILYVVSRPLQINTSASIRNKATISGLVENGYQIDLVTTSPDSNHLAYDSSLDINEVNCLYINLAGIQSLAKIGRKLKFLNPLHRLATRLFEKSHVYDNLIGMINHTNEIDLISNKYDFIISSSDPKSSHLFVEKLLQEQGEFFMGKWIQIWGDPFYDDITLPKNINKKKIFDEENRLISKADKIVYVSKLTLSRQQRRYSSNSLKMEYHPIPYNKEKIKKLANLNDKKVISVSYCGDYNSSVRDIMPLYEALKDMPNVKGIICGGADIQLKDTKHITILPRQNYSKIEEIEDQSDILVHLSNLHGSQIPGKLYQYSGTNKPILFILDGEKNQLLEDFKKYNRYVFANNDKESIKQGIKNILQYNKEYHPVQDFSKKHVANQIITF